MSEPVEPAPDDVFAPIRFVELDGLGKVVLSVLVAVFGAVTGLLGTLQHLAVLEIGAVPIRFGIVLAFAASLLLLIGLRGAIDGRLPVVLAAAALGGVVVLAQVPSPAGTVLVTGDPLSQIWGFGMPFLALLVAAWPRFAHTPRPEGEV
jgi:hypothetical protein